jgi:hypothetical protein
MTRTKSQKEKNSTDKSEAISAKSEKYNQLKTTNYKRSGPAAGGQP